MEAISSFSLLISLTGFPLVLALARVIITTGSMRRFLNPTEVADRFITSLHRPGYRASASAFDPCSSSFNPFYPFNFKGFGEFPLLMTSPVIKGYRTYMWGRILMLAEQSSRRRRSSSSSRRNHRPINILRDWTHLVTKPQQQQQQQQQQRLSWPLFQHREIIQIPYVDA